MTGRQSELKGRVQGGDEGEREDAHECQMGFAYFSLTFRSRLCSQLYILHIGEADSRGEEEVVAGLAYLGIEFAWRAGELAAKLLHVTMASNRASGQPGTLRTSSMNAPELLTHPPCCPPSSYSRIRRAMAP